MEIHLGQSIENIRGIAQLYPVELDILAGCEMAIALVIGPRDPGQTADLGHIQGAIGDTDPQHIGVQLQIKTVHQAQGLELIFAQLACQAAANLMPKLVRAVGQKFLINRIIAVHAASLLATDEVKATGRAGSSGRSLQGGDCGPAKGLLAVSQFICWAERPKTFAIADRGHALIAAGHIDEIGIHDDAGLRLGERHRRLGRTLFGEQFRVGKLLDPLTARPKDHVTLAQPIGCQGL